MNPLITIILLFLGLLTLVLLKKEQRGMAGGCATVLILLVIGQGIYAALSGSAGERNLVKARQVISDGLVQKISDRHPRGKVVILGLMETPNMNWMNANYLETQNELAKACKRLKIEVEILPYRTGPEANDSVRMEPEALRVEGDPNAESAEDFEEPEMVTAKLLTRRLLELKDRSDVVIMVLPLSPDFAASDLPSKDSAPHLVVMNAPNWDDLESVMETSVLDTVLMFRANSSELVLKEWPKDDAKAFDERYYFLTAGSKGPQGLLSSGH